MTTDDQPTVDQANTPDQAKPGASRLAAPTLALPKAGGAIRGIGEKFTANPVTGTGSMSVPLAVSPGRGGFGPALALSYDSGAGNGPFGFGWQLSLPMITRKTDKGLPRYADAAESDVFLLSDAEDLVPLLDPEQGWQRAPLFEPEHAAGYRIDRYRPRIEGLFARIERWTRLTDGDVHWRSVTRDNLTTWYGADENSRIADPRDPARVFSWLICRSYDDKGNAAVYRYAAENGSGVDTAQAHERHRTIEDRRANRYLKQVLYGNRVSHVVDPELTDPDWMFEVVLDYGEHDPEVPTPGDTAEWLCRMDSFSSYRSGFEVRTYRLCRRVLMFHHFPAEAGVGANCLVRSTDFDYRPGDTVGTFLTGVTQRGYRRDGTTYVVASMPQVEFSYSPAEIHGEVAEFDAVSLANLPAGLAGAGHQWVDLDGDGISGILAERAGAWYFKPNLGGGRFGPLRQVSALPSMAGGQAVQPQLLDLAGDGQLDLVSFGGPDPGFAERTGGDGWSPWRAFPSLPRIDWADPNLRFVDLDGDGHADVLVTEHEALTWYPSLAEDGFGPARRVWVPLDEKSGPRLVFADGTESIHLADMSGDGLTDLIRIRNGEVCYWPNLGHGRFGARVIMDDAPWFDRVEMFDQRRLLLADVDGSGVTDIVYLAGDEARIYLNRSGNGWAAPHRLTGVSGVDDPSTAATVDLFGTGTACLVWSSARPGDERRSVRYVDLLGGGKPHLLVGVDNNLGAQTTIHYVSSTRFALADKAAGRPWLTKLAFPVQVVERVETHDLVGRNRFVSRYAYHHGYFDGAEREFRGFGMVEQWDTEEIGALGDSAVPPVWTKTWFHNGALAATQVAGEYYREPGLTDLQHAATLLPDTVWPDGLTPHELREAIRALKGSMLRQEVYALDGSEKEGRPHRVTESNQTIELVQPRAGNRHAVFFTHPRETLRRHYERALYDIEGAPERLADPRVTHELVLDVDGWGNVLRSASVGYGRRFADADVDPRLPAALLAELSDLQTTLHATVSVNDVTEAVVDGAVHRAPLPCEAKTYELVNIAPAAGRFRLDELRSLADTAQDLPFEDTWAAGVSGALPFRRLLEHTRTVYRRNDLSGPLPFGELESLALPYESYQLAFTPGLLDQIYQRDGQGLLPDAAAVLGADGGYVSFDDRWWIPSGQVFYSAAGADEVTEAVAHFWLPRRFRDPFGQTTSVAYDSHDLAVVETWDPLDNRVSAITDYRVLAPREVADPNGNVARVLFDALGLVVATAVRGKPGEPVGDTLDGVDPDLPEAAVLAHLADPLADPDPILGSASTRLLYDLFAFARTKSPAVVYTVARETHVSDLVPGQSSRLRHGFGYCDGFGRTIQAKAQAEPDTVPDSGPRWVGSGWTIFNNKGKPVRQYEPFFSTTHHFEFAETVGVSPVLCYDPVERVVATLAPDDSYAKVLFDPWRQSTWDGNDTVRLDPRVDDDVRGFLTGFLLPGWQTWWQQRAGGAMGPREHSAAAKAEAHAGTPTVAYADTLGRTVVTVTDRGLDQLHPTRVVLDIEGLQREVVDARGVSVLRQDFDVAGRTLRTHSPDAGDRWILPDILGKPIRRWDGRGHDVRQTYDALRRSVQLWNGDSLAELVVYGETHPEAVERNLRGRPHRHYDGAGLFEAQRHGFTGNLLLSSRRLAVSYQDRPNWAVELDAQLGPESFATATLFDALNRPVSQTLPDGTVIVPSYNEAGLLETVGAHLRGAAIVTTFVTDIDYDAKGQRSRIDYGNGVTTTYTYDPFTFRLRHLDTVRAGGALQDLSYVYDPAGNITSIADAAQQTVFFAGKVVTPDADYTYDASYRLIAASGREHSSLGGQPDHADPIRHPLPHPNDAQALRNYSEHYSYDPVGNILALVHQAGPTGSWTRRYSYAPESNRLLAHSIPGDPADGFSATFDHDPHGNLTRMPHLPELTWDFEDQFSSVDLAGGGTAFYTYDTAGERVRKVIEHPGGLIEERIYLGPVELYRKRVGGTLTFERQTVHVMDDTRRICLVETTTLDPSDPATVLQPRQRYQLANHLGSSTLEVNETASVISYEEYHPYGTTSLWLATGAAEVSTKRYRYTGKEKDDETSLYYHGARYYAPWLARWIAVDPAGIGDGLCLYKYVRNNPIVMLDPNGEEGFWSFAEKARDTVKGAATAVLSKHPVVVAAKQLYDYGEAVAGAESLEKVPGRVLNATPYGKVKNALAKEYAELGQRGSPAERGFLAANKVLNPVTKGILEVKATVESAQKGDYKAVGTHGANAVEEIGTVVQMVAGVGTKPGAPPTAPKSRAPKTPARHTAANVEAPAAPAAPPPAAAPKPAQGPPPLHPSELPTAPGTKVVAGSPDGPTTLSGYGPGSQLRGHPDASLDVWAHSFEIGHPHRPAGALDQGVYGRFYASHAERQAYIRNPGDVTVSAIPCGDCQRWFRNQATYSGKKINLHEPGGTWTFGQDSSVWVNPPLQRSF